MIMLNVWHPDIIEFIVSKMQNPDILRVIIQTTDDEQIKHHAQEKLAFTPLTEDEIEMYTFIATKHKDENLRKAAQKKLDDGGVYSVKDEEFLSGANISVGITKEFMDAVENDAVFELKFPDVESYSEEEMKAYDEKWHEIGDVREWEKMGYRVKVYRTIRAKDLWKLINICATYSAEPGVFFIDNANEMTNAKAYGQSVVATNPCGEQPLAPYSVCNLAAINLSSVADFKTQSWNKEELKEVVRDTIRLQDNVIDATPYFLEENRKQGLGERRIGLGVMGLHDLLIKCGVRYGSKEGNAIIDEVFETIAVTAYETSISLAREKGSFPFLIGNTDEETMKLRKAFINTGYMKQMPEHIRQDILKYGIRNSHLLTVAPTGSTGTMVGTSTGLEPYFAFEYYRNGRLGQNIRVQAEIVKEFLEVYPEYDEDNLPDYFVSAMDLTPEEHVGVQLTIQRWVDSSLSKTVNAPKGFTVEQVQEIYQSLYKGGAKGGTVYVDGSRNAQVLELIEEKEQNVGTNIGDICPSCRKGEVVEAGGCNTCNNCGIQLQCGL